MQEESLNLAELKLPSPVTQIHNPLLEQNKIQLFIKRDELIHPELQGNKWRKLKYNLLTARNNKLNTLLSFGGTYSNHLHALAAAGKAFNFKTIGIVRGEQHTPANPCIQDMLNWGMQLKYVSRIDYKNKTSSHFIEQLKQEFEPFYLIPEGGNNEQGMRGCGELLTELEQDYDFICSEVGSGTMLSSLIINNKNPQTKFLGFAVMKNPQLDADIQKKLNNNPLHNTQWEIIHQYHFSGFAKTTEELNAFILDFRNTHNIQLEPVYSGKMIYGIFDLVEKGYFKKDSKILAIHGGGLQGLRGFPQLFQS